MPATRIYYVTAEDGEARLVRATSPAQAIRHVARDRYRVAVASQETIVEMVSAGDPVETAGDEPVGPEERQMVEIATQVRALDEPQRSAA
jgi:hypothetical protein